MLRLVLLDHLWNCPSSTLQCRADRIAHHTLHLVIFTCRCCLYSGTRFEASVRLLDHLSFWFTRGRLSVPLEVFDFRFLWKLHHPAVAWFLFWNSYLIILSPVFSFLGLLFFSKINMIVGATPFATPSVLLPRGVHDKRVCVSLRSGVPDLT